MKNLHVLPTKKPSILYAKDDNYKLANSTMAMDWYISSAGYKPYNIYITSDEEIKEGDYIFETDTNKVNIADKDYYRNEFDFKIILTTDPDLIADGVQAIDDKFLEWFVKNPSCEFVEVYEVNGKLFAEPIIPQEEPEQSVEEYTQQGLEKYFEEPEQETLEEAIKQELENHFFSNISEIKQAEYFINFGAKWQQEQDKKMYSEEDLEVAYFSGIKTTGEGWNGEYANGNNPSIEEEFQEGFQEWLRQFKNK